MKKTAGILLIMLAGILWGCMGLFVRPLDSLGLSSMDIVFLRAFLTALVMVLILLIKDRNLFKIRIKDIWCFAGTGLLSIVFFNLCYFKEITITSLAVASVLLYTAPAFVMIISAFCFKEKLTKMKIAALLLSFLGLIFVTGVLGSADTITLKALLFGLGAGLGYALYSIFGRFAIERGYGSLNISFYTFVFASIGSVFFSNPKRIAQAAFAGPGRILLIIAFVLVSTVIPYIVYTLGLKEVENGQAAIIASVEPVVASLNGIIWFHESLSFSVAIGIILVLGGIVLSNLQFKKKEKNDNQEKMKPNKC